MNHGLHGHRRLCETTGCRRASTALATARGATRPISGIMMKAITRKYLGLAYDAITANLRSVDRRRGRQEVCRNWVERMPPESLRRRIVAKGDSARRGKREPVVFADPDIKPPARCSQTDGRAVGYAAESALAKTYLFGSAGVAGRQGMPKAAGRDGDAARNAGSFADTSNSGGRARYQAQWPQGRRQVPRAQEMDPPRYQRELCSRWRICRVTYVAGAQAATAGATVLPWRAESSTR